MRYTFERLMEMAAELHEKLYGMSREDAIVEIVKVFSDIDRTSSEAMLEAVENKLLHSEHH